jgi:hypothetical protein
MSDSNRQITEAIQRIAGTWGKDYINVIVARVVDVDDEAMTCTIDPINDSSDVTINNVLLSAEANDGLIQYPSVDSIVLVAYGVKQQPFILMFSDIDKCRITIDQCDFFIDKNGIKLFGDNFGGLVKINNLKTQYDASFNTFKAACVAAFTAQSAIDGGVGLSAFNGAISALQPLDKTALENTKVQHGNI